MRATPYRPLRSQRAAGEISLTAWIHDRDLLLPGPQARPPAWPGNICGASYRSIDPSLPGWVIFDLPQAIQVVDIELHPLLHTNKESGGNIDEICWVIEDSRWMASFKITESTNTRHFIVKFRNSYIIEVLCRELIFGDGLFDIEHLAASDPRFALAYFKRAMAYEDMGCLSEALADLRHYISIEPDIEEKSWVIAHDIQRVLDKIAASSVG